MALEYSNRATIGYAELYKSINKVTVFIEDTKGRLIYERILEKLWGPGKVERVFPLNGREFVINDWRKNLGNRSYIYIIDGDLDIISGRLISRDNLVQLDRYCLENYLIDEKSIAKVLEDYIPENADHEIVMREFSDLIRDIGVFFLGIFILYAISQKHQVGEKCISEGSLRYFGRQGFKPEALRARMRYFYRTLAEAIGREKVRADIAEIRSNVSSMEDALHSISGKSHVLPIVHKISEWKYRYTGNLQVFSNQLSNHSSISRESAIGKKLISLGP